jgi:hypothetical protein
MEIGRRTLQAEVAGEPGGLTFVRKSEPGHRRAAPQKLQAGFMGRKASSFGIVRTAS